MIIVLGAIIYMPLFYFLWAFDILFGREHFDYVDKKGKPIFPKINNEDLQMDDSDSADEFIVVLENEKYGYHDSAGNLVIPPRFEYACPFSDGLAHVNLPDGQRAFIDKRGRIAFKVKGEIEVADFHNGIARVMQRRRVLFDL